ncbi:MAG: hypothetical protein ACP5MG_09740 [Verrucomicrobiia bacterium]|jgi:hypothetical protein
MEKIFKKLVEKISPRETRELVETHIKKIQLDENTKTVTLFVDKRYAFNLISSHDQIPKITNGVKKAFGEDYKTTLKLDSKPEGSEREKALPHTIHYT